MVGLLVQATIEAYIMRAINLPAPNQRDARVRRRDDEESSSSSPNSSIANDVCSIHVGEGSIEIFGQVDRPLARGGAIGGIDLLPRGQWARAARCQGWQVQRALLQQPEGLDLGSSGHRGHDDRRDLRIGGPWRCGREKEYGESPTGAKARGKRQDRQDRQDERASQEE